MGELAGIGDRDAAFPLPHERRDEGNHGGSGADSRSKPPVAVRPRDLYTSDPSLYAIKLRTIDFG